MAFWKKKDKDKPPNAQDEVVTTRLVNPDTKPLVLKAVAPPEIEGQEFTVYPAMVNGATVGSAKDAVIQVQDKVKSVSRNHCSIQLRGSTYCVTDRQSANGTRMRLPNGVIFCLNPNTLTNVYAGSTIQVGAEVMLQVVSGAEELPENYVPQGQIVQGGQGPGAHQFGPASMAGSMGPGSVAPGSMGPGMGAHGGPMGPGSMPPGMGGVPGPMGGSVSPGMQPPPGSMGYSSPHGRYDNRGQPYGGNWSPSPYGSQQFPPTTAYGTGHQPQVYSVPHGQPQPYSSYGVNQGDVDQEVSDALGGILNDTPSYVGSGYPAANASISSPGGGMGSMAGGGMGSMAGGGGGVVKKKIKAHYFPGGDESKKMVARVGLPEDCTPDELTRMLRERLNIPPMVQLKVFYVDEDNDELEMTNYEDVLNFAQSLKILS